MAGRSNALGPACGNVFCVTERRLSFHFVASVAATQPVIESITNCRPFSCHTSVTNAPASKGCARLKGRLGTLLWKTVQSVDGNGGWKVSQVTGKAVFAPFPSAWDFNLGRNRRHRPHRHSNAFSSTSATSQDGWPKLSAPLSTPVFGYRPVRRWWPERPEIKSCQNPPQRRILA